MSELENKCTAFGKILYFFNPITHSIFFYGFQGRGGVNIPAWLIHFRVTILPENFMNKLENFKSEMYKGKSMP